MTYNETAIVATIEQLAGTSTDELSQSELDIIDQFHAGGSDAVSRLIPMLGIGPRSRVLDVGAGFGGPARQIARATQCNVVGVDVTADYVSAAVELTRRAGLAGQVSFEHTDVAELNQSDFDAAYTIHVQMNVADKTAFYRQIGARLRPGGRLAVFEVCRCNGDPTLPLPWSLDGRDSFLASADELHSAIVDAGYEASEWTDESDWIRQWFAESGARNVARDSQASLRSLLADGPVRLANFAAAVFGGAVSIQRGAFRRTA
jgi:cyclopropane fatty-acyl-phospholipid synthase-like methyltransferase